MSIFEIIYSIGFIAAIIGAGFHSKDGNHKDMITMLFIAMLFLTLSTKELVTT